MTDPMRQRDQPGLTTSSGLIWLVVGGLLAVICLLVLVPLMGRPPAGVALAGVVVVAALYVAMLLVRLVVPTGRRRLGLMAAGMIGIAAVTLVAVLVVAGAAASP